jgi:hypothetical protein
MAYVLRLLLDSADVSRLGGEYRRRQEPPTESSQPTEVTPIDRALQALADGLWLRELADRGTLLLRMADGSMQEVTLRQPEAGIAEGSLTDEASGVPSPRGPTEVARNAPEASQAGNEPRRRRPE